MTFHPGLSDLAVTRVEDTPDTIIVHCTYRARPPELPDDTWWLKDYRTVYVHDLPHGNKPVLLALREPRYVTRHGRRLVRLKAPWRVPGQQMTRRVVPFSGIEWLRHSTRGVASLTGRSQRAVRRLVVDVVEHVAAAYRPVAVRHLGLDECHLKVARATLCDLRRRTLVDIAEGYGTAQVEAMLRRLAGLETVEVVVIDFTPRYAKVVRRVFPNLKAVVIDRWHGEKQARAALERELEAVRDRRAAQGLTGGWDGPPLDRGILLKPYAQVKPQHRWKVDTILDRNEWLRRLYYDKEAFCAIYQLRSRAAAEAAYDAWVAGLDSESSRVFRRTIALIRKWRAEVFAYFDHRLTNGPTEGLNDKLKDLADLGRRQDAFATFRARALLRFGPPELRAALKAGLEQAAPLPPRRPPAEEPPATGGQLSFDI